MILVDFATVHCAHAELNPYILDVRILIYNFCCK